MHVDHESDARVAIHERVVADDAGRVGGGHIDDVGRSRVGVELLRPGESGLQEGFVAPQSRIPGAPPWTASRWSCNVRASRTSLQIGGVTWPGLSLQRHAYFSPDS